MKIAVFFVGEVHDKGFNAAALVGAERVRALPSVTVEIVSGIPYDHATMAQALHTTAAANDAVIFVGGQGNNVTPPVAQMHPDKLFAVVQGDVTGPNLASYDVLQEQSAFLAGCLAARLTQSGVIGHLSGHRVKPGLKGRAAFVAGAVSLSPDLRVLTGFCGTQDDSAITRTWAAAQIAAGADILFTMLNGARQGAIEACRSAGARQIGNAQDWCVIEPAVFLASALARIDLGVEQAARDMLARQVPQQIQHLGLAQGDAVALRLAADVPSDIADEMAQIAGHIATGALTVPTTYDGDEFTP